MARVLNKRIDTIPEGAVYVGRPSKWGNPFRIDLFGREGAIRMYEESLDGVAREAIRKELKGKDLVCWCAPEACHADVLLEIANS